MPTTDPTARITAALTTYSTAKAIYGAAALDAETAGGEEWRVRGVMPLHASYIETIEPVCEALEVGWLAVLARLAAAEAVIMAYKIDVETNWLEDGMAARNALYAALTAYDALAGTGEGTG